MLKTNYVVVVDYEEGQTLDNCCLLGWDNKTDWFDTDTYGFEILNDDGSIKDRTYCCIEIDRWVGVYVGETVEECKDYSDDGNKEGYDCTVCKLIKTENGYDLEPVEDEEDDL